MRFLGRLEGALESSWDVLEPSWGVSGGKSFRARNCQVSGMKNILPLGPCGGVLKASLRFLGHLKGALESSWDGLEPTRGISGGKSFRARNCEVSGMKKYSALGTSWRHLEGVFDVPGASSRRLGVILGFSGAVLGRLG